MSEVHLDQLAGQKCPSPLRHVRSSHLQKKTDLGHVVVVSYEIVLGLAADMEGKAMSLQEWLSSLSGSLDRNPLSRICYKTSDRHYHTSHPMNISNLGSHLIAKMVIEGQMAIWPWKQAMAAETGYGRRNPFGREKKRENGTI